MRSLEELAALREQMKDRVILREGSADTKIVVGMATCGIAAGALSDHVTVSQTGCIGICQYEPVVEIMQAGKDKVTYVKMTPEKARRVVAEHIKGGSIVEEYTIGKAE